jgi:uncharacterized protein (DUF1778 family)
MAKAAVRARVKERRTVTDDCLTALAEPSQETVTRHESLALSDRDRRVFFNALIHAPRANARLRRAFRSTADLLTC